MRITAIFGYPLRIETSRSTVKLTWFVWKKTWTEFFGRWLDSAQLLQVELIATASFVKIDSLVVLQEQNWRDLERWWTITEFPVDNVRIPDDVPLPFLLRCCWVGFSDVIWIIDEERSDQDTNIVTDKMTMTICWSWMRLIFIVAKDLLVAVDSVDCYKMGKK